MAFAAVLICIYNDLGKFLVQKRTADAPTYPSHWSLFAGTVEKDEEPIATLKREILEELEYELINPRFHATVEHDGPKHFYSEKFREGFVLVLHEGDAMRWVSLDELKNMKHVPYHIKPIEKIFEEVRISLR